MKKILSEIELKRHIYKKVLLEMGEIDKKEALRKEAVSALIKRLSSGRKIESRYSKIGYVAKISQKIDDGVFRFEFPVDCIQWNGIMAPDTRKTEFIHWAYIYDGNYGFNPCGGIEINDEIKDAFKEYNNKKSNYKIEERDYINVDDEFNKIMYSLGFETPERCNEELDNLEKIDKLHSFKLGLEYKIRKYEETCSKSIGFIDNNHPTMETIRKEIFNYKKAIKITDMFIIKLKAELGEEK